LEIQNPQGNKTDINSEFSFEDNGEFSVRLDKPSEFRPGLYKLIVKIEDNSTSSPEVQMFEQEFRWGVLAINTNKSIYLPNEQAYIQIAALQDDGHKICDANLKLEITEPNGQVASPEVQKSGECGPDNVTDIPDYFAFYQIAATGTYQMRLTNLNNGYEIEDSFEVRESVAFDVERIGPTRIYPPVNYEMEMIIKANQDFTGQVIEKVPASFEITETGDKRQETGDEEKNIIWEVDWKTEGNYELNYQFDAPDISPYLYLLGPLEFTESGSPEASIFRETRQWQIAADSPTAAVVKSHNVAVGTGGTTATVNYPSGIQAGDLLILVCTTDGTGSALSGPSGWNVLLAEAQVQSQTTDSWWKEATGSESGSVSVTWSGNEDWVIGCIRVSGADTTTPIAASATSNSTGNIVNPSVTTTEDDQLVIFFHGLDDDDQGDNYCGDLEAGPTCLYARQSSGSWGECSGGFAHQTIANQGDTGTRTWSIGGSEGWYAATIAIAPGAPPPGPTLSQTSYRWQNDDGDTKGAPAGYDTCSVDGGWLHLGRCWHKAAPGASCNTACSSYGGCVEYYDTDGYIVHEHWYTCSEKVTNHDAMEGKPCFENHGGVWWCDNGHSGTDCSTLSDADFQGQRLCVCASPEDKVNDNTNSADIDTSLEMEKGERATFRVQIENSGGVTTTNYKLQWAATTTEVCTSSLTWQDVASTTEIAWSLGLSGTNNASITTSTCATNTNTWIDGRWFEATSTSGNFTIGGSAYTEFAFMLETSNAATGTNYCLRLINETASTTLNGGYDKYAQLSIVSPAFKRYSKDAVSSIADSDNNIDLTSLLSQY